MTLPRDAYSVPVARRICQAAMVELRVKPPCIDDVALAVSEACSNVIEHSSDIEDEYEIRVELNDHQCEIRVIDTGRGFDSESLGGSQAEGSSVRGRGVNLMRALVDKIRFDSQPEAGTVVHLVKRLHFDDDAPLTVLAQRKAARQADSGEHPAV